MRQKGFAPLIVFLIISALAAAGLITAYAIVSQNTVVSSPTPQEIVSSPSVYPKPTSSSTPTFVPTLVPTPKATPVPTKKPTPKPTTPIPVPTQGGCSKFDPSAGLTTLTISLKEKNGNALAGDWTVTIKPTGSCPGILPPSWGSQLLEVVRQPTYTYTSPGMGPGQFRVDVSYHASSNGFDWDGTSGNHTNDMQVSN